MKHNELAWVIQLLAIMHKYLHDKEVLVSNSAYSDILMLIQIIYSVAVKDYSTFSGLGYTRVCAIQTIISSSYICSVS